MAQLVWNQVLNKNDYISPSTNRGVEFTVNYESGAITVNGTSTASSDGYSEYLPFNSYTISLAVVKDHKYLFLSHNYSTNSLFRWIIGGTSDSVFDYEEVYAKGTIKTGLATKTGTSYMILRVGGGITVSNQATKPMLIDLTIMFGTGNEPATVDEFLSMFPNPSYFYGTNRTPPVVNSVSSKIYMNKSIEWNQLFDKGQFSTTKSECGMNFTNNGDGTWTVVGTKNITQGDNFYLTTVQLTSGHKYFLTGKLPSDKDYRIELLQSSIQYDAWREGAIFTCAVSGEFKAYMDIYETNVEVVFKPQLFDLTQMFGAGNEPTTLAEFWSYFENKVYDYDSGTTKPLFRISRKNSWCIKKPEMPKKGNLLLLDDSIPC